MPPCVVIAGTHSGVGKTTFALALMAALRARGLVVQPFKVGPDFIDPGHHTAVCGRVSRNLDTWMLDEAAVRAVFDRGARGADVAVVEGVMGLFDGKGPDDARGSTADVARVLGAPVVLVADAAGAAASLAAVVKGFSELDPAVRVAGVVCNRVAGLRHYDYLAPAIRRHTAVAPLGWLPRRPEWHLPERHLGLVTADERAPAWARPDEAARLLAETVEVDRILAIAAEVCREPAGVARPESSKGVAGVCRPPHALRSAQGVPPGCRVGVARDAAFCFYYPENLELLAAAGATVTPFSPLADDSLPPGTELLYLGGGYPEVWARQLAASERVRADIRRFHAAGGAIYAECGGLMYACREIVDAAGTTFPMLNLLPARVRMQDSRAALGYVRLRTLRPTALGPAGTTARGHEFHYSRLEPLGPLTYVTELDHGRGAPTPDGLVAGRLLAGYAHLHFGSNPTVAAALVAAARG